MTLDDLYRAVRVAPLRSAADRPAGYVFATGLVLIFVTIATGLIVYVQPSWRSDLQAVAQWSFGVGILAFGISGIVSLVGFVFGVGRRVSTRFQTSHLTSVRLARGIAAAHREDVIHDCLHSVRLELRVNGRAPGKLPIAAGLMTAAAAGTRSLLLLPGQATVGENASRPQAAAAVAEAGRTLDAAAALLPELAWMVVAATFAGFVARGFLYDVQDRLLRMEGVLEKAATLVRPPSSST